jgi:nucleoside-diphosphate-sugar epimerase
MIALVTGSAGFVGRHMVAELRRRDWKVFEVDPADGLSGYDALDIFRETSHRYDLVVHCAAVSPHRAAIDGSPLAVGAGNLELDAAMFRWAARTKPGRVVYLSSSAAYPLHLQEGPPDVVRLSEWELNLHDSDEQDGIYGQLKVMGELLAEAYRQTGGAVTVVRPFSGYGEDQSDDFPFGAFRDRARRHQDPFMVWGDGTQVRDWVHVDDVVGAVLAAAEHEIDGPVNICTGIGTSMAELATRFAEEAGYSPRYAFMADKPAGVQYRVGDPSLLNEFYVPKVTIQEGVRRALAAEGVPR